MRRARRFQQDLEASNALAVRETTIGGSFAKRIETRSTDDLDIYLHIDFASSSWRCRGRRSPAQTLDRLGELLSEVFWAPIGRGRMSLRPQRHSVRVEVHDWRALAFDIVPLTFRRGTPSWVELPRRDGGWVKTSIRRQIALIEERAGHHGGLRGGIRLLKRWRTTLPPGPPESSWSTYLFEVLAMHACSSLPSTASSGRVFLETLDWIASTGLRIPVDLRRWRAGPVPKRTGFGVWDPAWPENDLAPAAIHVARPVLVSAARAALTRLRHLHRPDASTVADVFPSIHSLGRVA